MSAASLRARYMGDAVTTASPQRLLVMLYDRLALDLERAQAAFAAGDRAEANLQLQHAHQLALVVLHRHRQKRFGVVAVGGVEGAHARKAEPDDPFQLIC